ncbi:MAG TPA: rhomboid family intramembrane serine protease [Burkholderiales bacterium]|jgi:membrane associated rhomboid family serine protease|nr:rhomboid family intramembrane serine protease [Burkholderiales bacterium]
MAVRHDSIGSRAATLAVAIGVIWLIFAINLFVFGGRLLAFGILPRAEEGLRGVVLAPLLHGSVKHLLANTAGILIFGGLAMLRSRSHFWMVTIVGAIASGIGTWLFGRPAIHVGASGIVFAYFGYLLFTGFFERRIGSLLLSIAVFFVWGPTIYGILPLERDISWEGHLFGFIGGMLAAWVLAGRPFRGGI